ncbi:hypothetical protein OCK02_04095 (plasmid) [Rhizobium sp. TRM96647]|uniref:hypothetical protein n=1 Tax=unclassified Rhizobium TaxID=2613769 RepID=UPI001E30CFD5|nr:MULTISPECIES: hypothetical protein [unclassified Rhizobium]MCD2180639.1 hypothetical protein [Rhizobium sp. GN54]MCV3735375.1 hypothetical protein [Rhizobium sp. TRM96647]MCV3757862.1 hypothetical protein [Rhizobium sp. TRM96650]
MYRLGCGAFGKTEFIRVHIAFSTRDACRTVLNDLADGEEMTQDGQKMETWACSKAQEIVLREGFNLIRSARTGNNTEIREHSMMLAKVIAASLLEASVATGAQPAK